MACGMCKQGTMLGVWGHTHKMARLHNPPAIYMDVGRGAPGSDVHDLVTATHLAASGPYQRAWYEQRGFAVENIRETGLPQFDDVKVFPREYACAALKLDVNKPVIT